MWTTGFLGTLVAVFTAWQQSLWQFLNSGLHWFIDTALWVTHFEIRWQIILVVVYVGFGIYLARESNRNDPNLTPMGRRANFVATSLLWLPMLALGLSLMVVSVFYAAFFVVGASALCLAIIAYPIEWLLKLVA